jgi:hypothetical protein
MAKPTLTQAVVELYGTIPGLPVVYNEEIPEDVTQIPSAYFLHQGEVPDGYHTRVEKPTHVLGKFTIVFFAIGIETVEGYAFQVMATFKPQSLQMTDNQVPILFRGHYTARGTKWRNKQGSQVHMAQIDYEATIANPKV